jgi:hypothetical protein
MTLPWGDKMTFNFMGMLSASFVATLLAVSIEISVRF